VECRDEGVALFRILPLFEFRDGAENLIHSYKTGERASLAHYFAYKVSQLGILSDNTLGDFFFVPVPPRPEKIRTGKLDQVGALAKALGHFGFQCKRLLKRLPGGRQQKLLDRAERLKNASTSYALQTPGHISDRIVLLDDVCTTGATLGSCAKVLTEAGAKVLGAIVLAAD
jgi:predicted amidophosphoribosyltransferase